MKHRFQVVRIVWRDAFTRGGWKKPETDTSEEFLIHSAGYLLPGSKRYVRIALSLSQSGTVDDILAIPRGCVVKVDKLRGGTYAPDA